jgi:uncharacterized membrane protein YoaK (UPF0700 family)
MTGHSVETVPEMWRNRSQGACALRDVQPWIVAIEYKPRKAPPLCEIARPQSVPGVPPEARSVRQRGLCAGPTRLHRPRIGLDALAGFSHASAMIRPATPPADAITDKRVGLLIVCCLAALAGAVDACGFFLLKDLYVSFMSGNTTSMAAALARGDFARVGLIGGIIATFVAGTAAGTVVGELAGSRHVPVVILATALVLVVPAAAKPWSIHAMTFAMGTLNASIHQAGSVEVTVTYVTGTLARLGRGLGLLLCGQVRDWAWLQQAVPWLGLVGGAALATLSLIRVGDVTLLALPVAAALIGAASWLALAANEARARHSRP